MTTISHLLFDLGGVMLEVEKANIFRELGRITGRDATGIADTLQGDHAFWTRFAVCEHSADDVAAWVNRLLGTSLSPAVVEAAFNAELGPAIDSTVQLLPTLRGRVSLGCLSNTNSIHWNALTRSYEMMQLFDRLFASQQLGCAKPGTAIYRRVEELLGAVPQQILFFDDKPENVVAATQLGWHARVYSGFAGLRADLCSFGLLD